MFVARLLTTHQEGKEKRSMYLKPDGSATTVKGEAMQFGTREEMDRFLKTTASREGTPPEVEMETL